MLSLEDLQRGAVVKGISPDGSVSIVDVNWFGTSVVEVTYKDEAGNVGNALIYRDQEADLELVEPGRAWSFDADGELFRLASEARRIQLAHLFDPLLAVHTSLIDPLPHQIEAVYHEMIPRQPLRFLLADDPGAGKTIMAGLLVRELMLRGDVQRCLVIVPGNLVEQWQDELAEKFHLPFEIITRDNIESARTGNIFAEYDMAIARLDQLSRDETLHEKLKVVDWDLVIVDEAHKMSAHYAGDELKTTKRHQLGRRLRPTTRHFLLMTATPHNGKEPDFQAFMALLDGDRFEGKFREGTHQKNYADLMRRLQKEELLKFDGTPLFPDRRAYTIRYPLSEAEAALYHQVTDYVREEMNRAERLKQEGEGRRGNTVGFALTTLQRRVASSPEAIYQSLKRRRERLESRLREEKLLKRGAGATLQWDSSLPGLDDHALDDLEDAPDAEVEELEQQVVDQATAARTIDELKAEIESLERLERRAHQLRQSGTDRKWEELRSLLQERAEMYDRHGQLRKLVIFSEHLDTVHYLADRLRDLLGKRETVVTIDGRMRREERRVAQDAFTQDKDVLVLVATDAASEGINLHRAHLMINYDLPWNPNRIEQRFGRIHRIGQEDVCHLWNLVADETREGEVFYRLLKKIEVESEALEGRVFNVLGKVFQEHRLRDLLIEAIRYGDREDVQARLHDTVDRELDHDRLLALIEDEALARDTLGVDKVRQIREDWERAQARRLQPHHIGTFFREAFQRLGGSLREREEGRYELTHVPATIRNRHTQIGRGRALQRKYERICFEKDRISLRDRPLAEFVAPGHPLLDAVIDLTLERYRDVLKRGAVLVDPDDEGRQVRALFCLEHSIYEGKSSSDEEKQHLVSRQMQFIEIDDEGAVHDAGDAPYHDYRPATEDEQNKVEAHLEADWLSNDLESPVMTYAVEHLVPRHLDDVKRRREEWVEKTMDAVKRRLTKEINYWDHRANQLRERELAGKTPSRLNSTRAKRRADDLQDRLNQRMDELERARHVNTRPPVVTGGALIVPAGLLYDEAEDGDGDDTVDPDERKRIERRAVEAVMTAERGLGYEPREMEQNHAGYDIESVDPETGRVRFIEVKGKGEQSAVATISRTQIMVALNRPEEFILAVVPVHGDEAETPRYIRRPFTHEPDFGVTSVNYSLDDLLHKAGEPS